MTSLIDVIFLLLLFFMLSSTFSRFADVELAASGGGAQASTETKLSFLKLGPDSVSLNGREIPIEGLSEAFATLPSGVDEARAVVVSLETDVSAQRLTDVLVVLRGIDRLRINVLGS